MPEPETLLCPPLRIAVAGSYAGRARYGAALQRLSSIHVAGIVDADTRLARGWARELNARPAVYADLDKLFEGDVKVDAVVIAYPRAERAAAIEHGIAAGCSILTEFPCTQTLAQYDRLTGLVEGAGVCLLPAVPQQHGAALEALEEAVSTPELKTIERVTCEAAFPLNAAYALENGVVPEGIDWYDLLQVIACRVALMCTRWLGAPLSVNADIDLPQHAAIAGRRASDPIANLIVMHENGQATLLLKLSRSINALERYTLKGAWGDLELTMSSGDKAAAGPTVRQHLTGQPPVAVYTTLDGVDYTSEAITAMLTTFAARVQNAEHPTPNPERPTPNAAKLAPPQANAQRPTPPMPYAPLPTPSAERSALEVVQAAFLSAREGIRVPLPLKNAPEIDEVLAG